MQPITCYDYDEQRWVTGQQAIELRKRQVAEDLELLEGPRGKAYAQLIKVNHQCHIALLRAELARLQ